VRVWAALSWQVPDPVPGMRGMVWISDCPDGIAPAFPAPMGVSSLYSDYTCTAGPAEPDFGLSLMHSTGAGRGTSDLSYFRDAGTLYVNSSRRQRLWEHGATRQACPDDRLPGERRGAADVRYQSSEFGIQFRAPVGWRTDRGEAQRRSHQPHDG